MAYDTQADFAAVYAMAAKDPVTGAKYQSFRSAEFDFQPITIRLHYHPLVMKPNKDALADRLIANKGINVDDSLIIFGGAFGWLGEALINKTGCAAVSVDTSAWVNAAKDQSADDELIAAIESNGLSHTTGHGKTLFDRLSNAAPRATIQILNEDLSNNGSRNRVRAALPKNPTRIITEEVWQVLTDQERTEYQSRLDAFGIELIHVIDNQII